ncbi:MAG: redoxin domain-containing protein [Fimbriimonas sp.]|nr:redoxin domain-containing protein [Fimbriimonas sp.]
MRLIWITAPAGLAFACIGLAFMQLARQPRAYSGDIRLDEPRHLITQQMLAETAAETNKLEPRIETTDVSGKKVILGARNAAKPQYIYFVVDGCPCSYDAEPLFHDLFNQFKGRVDFVTVTNADPAKAREWFQEHNVPYSVVSDQGENIIHAYEAKAAIYSVLVTPDGHVAKMWPGYSADILQDINATIAKFAGVPAKPFDAKYAPIEKATGCAFSDGTIK